MANLEGIIDSKPLKPVIINEKSNFVIITYWWGRGNMNLNMQKPCRDDLIAGQELIKQPIKFEQMIDLWIDSCEKMNCNYLVQEYPEFAVLGGYQMAINAKPLFIQKALQSCGNKAVVYIDGDMSVNNYPHIFDIQNVDYMARGWNIDPRANIHYLSKTKPICFDPFTFETSGGIMYFGNTTNGHKLLDMWAKVSALNMNKGKADDRIISLIISSKKLYIDMNILQLPIEYLWLTDLYEPIDKSKIYLNKTHWDRKNIMFEHAACLTSEEKAREQGAANDRQPKFYDKLVENQIECQTEGGIFFEHIIFENPEQIKGWEKYIKYMSTAMLYKDNEGEIIHPYYIVKYKQIYGNKNDIAIENVNKTKSLIKILEKIIPLSTSETISIEYNNKIEYDSSTKILYTNDIIPTILALHYFKKSVIYLPKNYDLTLLRKVKKLKNYELVSGISNDNEDYPIFNKVSPIYLSHESRILNHIIKICPTINDLNKNLKICTLFIQLIRCNFLISTSERSSSISAKSVDRSFKNIQKKERSLLKNITSIPYKKPEYKSIEVKNKSLIPKTKISKNKECPEGKILNPKTKRCILTKNLNKEDKKCPEGKILNPKTKRCILTKNLNKVDKKCPEGKKLNPKTNRCVLDKKIKK